MVTEFGEYRGSVSKKQSYAKGYIFVEFSKLNSSKKCIIKLLIQFLIYLFRSYKWNAGFSSFTLARLNAIWKEIFCLPIYIHVFNALYFVIKEIIANDFQCRVQLLKLNTDGFTKLIFRGKFIFSFYICQICLDEVFFIFGFPKFDPKSLV